MTLKIWQNSRVEQVLIPHDIDFVAAHSLVLAKASLIDASKLRKFVESLEGLRADAGSTVDLMPDTDVQSFVDHRLQELAPDAFQSIEIARDKNNRVAAGLRLWLRAASHKCAAGLLKIRGALLVAAERDLEVILPSRASAGGPVLLSQWWLANEERLRRDFDRLCDFYRRLNVLPIGQTRVLYKGQVIDRSQISQILGFAGSIENSVDAVSDRDFLVEFASFASLVGTHLSQMASELLLWSTHEFGFIRLREVSSSGTPGVKRIHSMLEVLRSRPSSIFGHLSEFLVELKALPLGYCQDLQESMPGLIEITQTLDALMEITENILPAVHVDAKRMKDAVSSDTVNADNAVEFLISRGLAQEKAISIVEGLIGYCKERNKFLSDLELNEWHQFSPAIDSEIHKHVTVEESAGSKALDEQLSPDDVTQAVSRAREALKSDQSRFPELRNYGDEVLKALKLLSDRR